VLFPRAVESVGTVLILLSARHAFLTLPWVSSAGLVSAAATGVQTHEGAGNCGITLGRVTTPRNRSNKIWPGGRETGDVLVRDKPVGAATACRKER
jgi:hypothetical protein